MRIETVEVNNLNFVPLSASYAYDDAIKFKGNLFELNSGHVLINQPILTGAKDVKIGNSTLFNLTSSFSLQNVLELETRMLDSTDFIVFTGLRANNNKYITNVSDTLYASATSLGTSEFFRLQKNTDGTFKIYQDEKVLTVSRTSPYNITLEDELETDTYQTQKFRLNYTTDKITIETMFEASWWASTNTPPRYIKRLLSYSATTENVRAIGMATDDDYMANNNYVFTLTYDMGLFTIGYDGVIRWIKYYNDRDNTTYNNTLDIKLAVSGIQQNYLLSTPYKTTDNELKFNLSPLKNILTPEYETTVNPLLVNNRPLSSIYTPENLKRREYDNIFIGSNEEGGYDSVYLGFTGNTKQMILPQGNVTYFHYPKTTVSLPLSSAGFYECGAIPGKAPIRSDKIWKKMANYYKNIYWGDSQQWQRGTYLCAWLSGDSTNAVWMDRWYNPGTANTVITLSGMDVLFTANSPYIYDEPSTMTLDPAVVYKYHHFGNADSNFIVDALKGDNGDNLKLNYDFISFDGSNETYVEYSSSLQSKQELSYSTWIKVGDWSNVKGNHIISNNYLGGWSMEYTNGMVTPIMSLYDSTYGHVMVLNNEGTFLFDKILPLNGVSYCTPTCTLMDNDYYTWILDNTSKKLYKMDYLSNIIVEVIFNASSNLIDMVQDAQGNICVLNSSVIPSIYKYNKDGVLVDFELAPTNSNKIDVTLTNIVCGYYCTDVCIDNNDVEWTINNDQDLYKGNTQILAGYDLRKIACDKDNNIWCLEGANSYMKFDNTGTLTLSGTVGNDTTSAERCIAFTNEYYDGENQDFVWFIQTNSNKIFKYDSVGNLIFSSNITDNVDITQYISHDKSTMLFKANGDFTNYDWQRKFKYDGNNYIKANINVGDNRVLSSVELKYCVSGLNNDEWYHFATTYSKHSQEYNMYVNSVKVDSEIILGYNPIYYRLNKPLYIGANCLKIDTLDKTFKLNNKYHFEGDLKDVRIYNVALNNSDINDIYLNDFTYQDLAWNMPIGEQCFIEEIERFFKHKMPGMKSQFYNIRLTGLNITDVTVRETIEDIIRESVVKISPAYSALYKIIWD